MGDNWWGDAWDTASDSVSSWFESDAPAANDTANGYNASNYDSTFQTAPTGSGTAWDNYDTDAFASDSLLDASFDMSPDTWSQDLDDESIWGKVGDFASGVGDFINTPVGANLTSGALGMLGQYLMDESASDKSRAMVGQAEGMMGGYEGPPEEEKVVEATTSNLGKW